MKSYNWNPFSLVDSPTGSAAVVYTCGCHLSCPYCFNPELRQFNSGNFDKKQIIKKIKSLQIVPDPIVNGSEIFNTVEWLIISGGEPLDAPSNELVEIINVGAETDLRIGFFTSGYNIHQFKQIIDQTDIEYFHIDYKGLENDKETLESIEYLYERFCSRYNHMYIHINTTIMRSFHTEEKLFEMKKKLMKILYKNKNIPIFINKPDTSDRLLFWTLTPISINHQNTLTKLNYIKDGFLEEDLDFLKAIVK